MASTLHSYYKITNQTMDDFQENILKLIGLCLLYLFTAL